MRDRREPGTIHSDRFSTVTVLKLHSDSLVWDMSAIGDHSNADASSPNSQYSLYAFADVFTDERSDMRKVPEPISESLVPVLVTNLAQRRLRLEFFTMHYQK
jgi:hypothetical protein